MLRLNDYRCIKCEKTFERIEHDGIDVLCECGGVTQKFPPIFRVNMGPVPIGGYYDDNLQTYINNKSHREDVMRKQGVSERGATPKNGPAWI